MASLIRTRLSDLCMRREVSTFGEETFGYNYNPGSKPSYLCPVGPRTTDVPHPGASTLISAPRSKQLGHQIKCIWLKCILFSINLTNMVILLIIFRILLLDWDVHHGNGIQHMFEQDPRYFNI